MALVPLTFALGYYADLTYGSKVHRIQGKCSAKETNPQKVCTKFQTLVHLFNFFFI